MKEKDLKQYGKDISKMIPALLKDASKVPQEVLNQETEFKNLEQSIDLIKKEINCEIEIEKAEQTKSQKLKISEGLETKSQSEQKAKNAAPSKPAILIE